MKGDMVLHDFEFLGSWLTQTELMHQEHQTPSLKHLLTACVRAYAIYLVTQNETLDYSTQQRQKILDTYRRLNLESSKTQLVQNVLQATTNLKVLSPLLAASVLSSSAKHPEAALHLFWRYLFYGPAANDLARSSFFHRALQWMKTGLDIHLTAMLTTPRRASDLTLAYEWWILLVKSSVELDLSPLLFRLAPAFSFSGEPALVNVPTCCFPLLDAASAFRWATMTLATANARNRRYWIQIILEAAAGTKASQVGMSYHWSSVALLKALSVIASETEECADVAIALSEFVANLDTSHINVDDKPTTSLVQLFEQNYDSALIRAVASRDFKPSSGMLSEVQQIASVLFGILLLEHNEKDGMDFLTNLLRHYPHLCITVSPVVLHQVQSASQLGDEKRVLRRLEFLSQVLVRDAHCAVEVWSIVSAMLSPNMPLAVRITAIRLLPSILQSNRRMYCRVVDALAAMVSSRQAEVRLAIAATLADLAKNDCISDVADVIGCIQGLLADEAATPFHGLIVHFGILSLHYLVLAGDLTFEIVVKVINKRMLSSGVSNLQTLLSLPPVAQETLVLLLGDGECDGGSSEDSDDDGATSASETRASTRPPSIIPVSPQVSSSVRALIRVATEMHERRGLEPWNAAQARLMKNIYRCLAAYSTAALNLTEEGIKSVVSYFDENSSENMTLTEAGERYISLRNLAIVGIANAVYDRDASDQQNSPVIALARKLLVFEEETIGASLWRKHGRHRQTPSSLASTKSSDSSRLERGISVVLPDPAKVQQVASERSTSPGAATALLMSSDGSQLSVIRDNGDAALDTSDPLFLVFALQSYLHVFSCLLSRHHRDDIRRIIDEVGSWSAFVSPDTMYLSLASICIYIPFDLADDNSPQRTCASNIFELIFEAYHNSQFEKDEVSKICLGLIAVSSIRGGSLVSATSVVNILEQSVKGYGGRQSFGAYYGLSIVCQALRQYLNSDVFRLVVPDARRLIYGICGFLVDEILSCYEERTNIFMNLIACLKSGVATSDLVESMSDLDAGSISLLMTKQVKARYLFISCALCLPTLSGLNGALHLATLRLMEAFEWGGGKGIALPPMLRACQSAELFEADELKQIYTSFAQIFEDRMDSREKGIDSDGLEDIFFAFNGTTSTPTTHMIRRTLVGNRDLFDDDGCILSLIAMTVSIAPVPCLGCSYFAIPGDIKVGAVKSDVESCVEIIQDAVALEDGKYSDMALILMAFLSSTKRGRELSAVEFSLPSELDKIDSSKAGGAMLSGIEFEKVPCPHAETTLAGILNQITSFESAVSNRDFKMPIVISALECLRLPEGFAKSFIEPLLRIAKGEVARSCVSLLCSQLSGLRRAAFAGRGFMLLALKMSSLSLRDWQDMGGEGEAFGVFVDSLAEIGTKLPPDSIGSLLEKTWENCVSFLRRGSPHLVFRYLSSVAELLGTPSLAPKTIKALRRSVGRIPADLQGALPVKDLLRSESGSVSIFDSFVQCLSLLATEVVDQEGYLCVIGPSGTFEAEAFTVLTLTALVDMEFFGVSHNRRGEVELSKVSSWIAKKLQLFSDDVDLYALRQVMHAFALATTRESTKAKHTRLSSLLDFLLQTKKVASRIGLQWLSMVMAQWSAFSGAEEVMTLGFMCAGDRNVARNLPERELEQLFELVLLDLPCYISTIASFEQISSSVSTQLNRVHDKWTEQQVDLELLTCIRNSIFACRGRGSSDDLFVSLSSHVLASSSCP
jgi:hypothetical protein